MPTYEYRCPSCKHDFELFQRMSDEPVASCPECGAESARRLSGGAGLLFKGSGFYITDYRSDGYKKAAGAEGGSGAEKGATSSGSSAGNGKASESKSSGSSASTSSGPTSSPKGD